MGIKTTKEILQSFMDSDEPVHIVLTNGHWINGVVVMLMDNKFVLKEEVFGDMIINYDTVKQRSIVKRMPKNENV